MDEVARYNRERWSALAGANALFSRPRLDLTVDSARLLADKHRRLGDLSDARVLCLGAGGGQQSAAFALLGANVTVVDLSPEQLAMDVLAAQHYGISIKTVEADMRDLSSLSGQFDIVDQPYSINFVPDCREVFAQVARTLKKGGAYRFAIANPFAMSIPQSSWNGEGYLLFEPLADGGAITYEDQDWVYNRTPSDIIQKPVEYRQNLGRIINGLDEQKFRIVNFLESLDISPDSSSDPGSWDHYVSYIPPWFSVLTKLEP